MADNKNGVSNNEEELDFVAKNLLFLNLQECNQNQSYGIPKLVAKLFIELLLNSTLLSNSSGGLVGEKKKSLQKMNCNKTFLANFSPSFN